jgi:adenylate kinase family enzyme
MRRIVVIGTSCSGKSTLARELSRRLEIGHIELDALHWGPNWTPNPDFADRVERAVSANGWVLDGGYAKVRHLIWPRADTMIWLDYPMSVVMMRGLRRTLPRAIRGTELWAGNRESLRLTFLNKESILLWIINTWRLRRRDYPALLRAARLEGKRVIRLRHPGDAEGLLQTIGPRHMALSAGDDELRLSAL